MSCIHPQWIIYHYSYKNKTERNAVVSFASILAATSLIFVSTTNIKPSKLEQARLGTGIVAFLFFIMAVKFTFTADQRDSEVVSDLKFYISTFENHSDTFKAGLQGFTSNPVTVQSLDDWKSALPLKSIKMRQESHSFTSLGLCFAYFGTVFLLTSLGLTLWQQIGQNSSFEKGVTLFVYITFTIPIATAVYLDIYYEDLPAPEPPPNMPAPEPPPNMPAPAPPTSTAVDDSDDAA